MSVIDKSNKQDAAPDLAIGRLKALVESAIHLFPDGPVDFEYEEEILAILYAALDLATELHHEVLRGTSSRTEIKLLQAVNLSAENGDSE